MDKKFISRRIKELRKAMGVSGQKMGLEIGQNKNYIRIIENGESLPSMTSFLKICDYFSISPNDFFNNNISANSYLSDELAKINNHLQKFSPEQLKYVFEIIKNISNLVEKEE